MVRAASGLDDRLTPATSGTHRTVPGPFSRGENIQSPGIARLVVLYVTTTAMTDALERDVHALLAAYDDGSWRPTDAEFELAGALARTHWSGSAFRTALRDVPEFVRAGRLVDVLDPATPVLELTDTSFAQPALLALRQMVDALAAA